MNRREEILQSVSKVVALPSCVGKAAALLEDKRGRFRHAGPDHRARSGVDRQPAQDGQRLGHRPAPPHPHDPRRPVLAGSPGYPAVCHLNGGSPVIRPDHRRLRPGAGHVFAAFRGRGHGVLQARQGSGRPVSGAHVHRRSAGRGGEARARFLRGGGHARAGLPVLGRESPVRQGGGRPTRHQPRGDRRVPAQAVGVAAGDHQRGPASPPPGRL